MNWVFVAKNFTCERFIQICLNLNSLFSRYRSVERNNWNSATTTLSICCSNKLSCIQNAVLAFTFLRSTVYRHTRICKRIQNISIKFYYPTAKYWLYWWKTEVWSASVFPNETSYTTILLDISRHSNFILEKLEI